MPHREGFVINNDHSVTPDLLVLLTGSVICETTGGVHVSVLW